jgi:hypothetical protein
VTVGAGLVPGSPAVTPNSVSASDIFPPDASSKLATLRPVVFSSADSGPAGFIDLEFDALVDGLVVGWRRDLRNSQTSASRAASDSASNDISKSSTASI